MEDKFKSFLYFFLGGIILLLFSWFAFSKSSNLSGTQFLFPTPTPAGWFSINRQKPVNSIFTPLQRTTINQTTDAQVKSLSNVLSTTPLDGNTTKYEVRSVNPLTPDEIITHDGIVVFERTSTYTDQPGGLPKFSAFITQLGQPDEIVYGNINYDEYVNSLIYFKKGIVVIGRQAIDEVYEIIRFTPMSKEEFYAKYGRYISPMDPHEH